MKISDVTWVMKSYNVKRLNKPDGFSNAYILRNEIPISGECNTRVVYANSLNDAISSYMNSGLNVAGKVIVLMSAEIS